MSWPLQELPLWKVKFKEEKVVFPWEMGTNWAAPVLQKPVGSVAQWTGREIKSPNFYSVKGEEITVFGAGTRGRSVLSYSKKALKFFLKVFLKTYPEFSVGRSSFDIKPFRLLRHFEIKSNSRFTCSTWSCWKCPFAHFSPQKRRNWESGNVQWFLGRVSGQSIAALLWQKPQLENSPEKRCEWHQHHNFRDTKKWDPSGRQPKKAI